ncbi:hypothetical protein BBJ28_00005768 [Nothophytophthora sp. Chile5]|nr:hypothetical protein BBJ28_00005768 [Nothophytophthora sp. Chile5]
MAELPKLQQLTEDDASLERSPTSGEMLARAAKTTLSRAGSLFQNTRTPCYIPPSVVGNSLTALPLFCIFSSSVEFMAKKERNFREFLNATDYSILLSARDYISDSVRLVAFVQLTHRGTGFMIETSGGRRSVSVEEFMQASELLQPELVVPLADEVPYSMGANRQRTAVQTSLDWLDACLALNTSAVPMCGVVVGGNDEKLRRMSAVETCKRDVQAVMLSGLSSCDDRAQRLALIDAIVSEISPASLPRVVSGIGHPLDVLDAVDGGIDAFVSPFPATVTKKGSALLFWVSDDEDGSRGSEREAERQRFGSVLHLREPRFATDFGPLLPGCGCFACQNYTRAYLHHLLNVREMLGDILLYLHNLQHYYLFFRQIRAAVDADRFGAFHAEFASKFDERPSTAPPLVIPLAISERKRKNDAEKAAARALEVAAKHDAAIRKRPRP